MREGEGWREGGREGGREGREGGRKGEREREREGGGSEGDGKSVQLLWLTGVVMTICAFCSPK